MVKPYYSHAGIVIYHGDCREILPEVQADVVVSDVPYGVNFDTDYRRFTSWFDVPRTNHKPVHGDSEPFDPTPWLEFPEVILWGFNCFCDRLPPGTLLVWDKRFKGGQAFLADGEAAWMKGGHGVYIHSETSQGFVRSERVQHPTQKPIALMQWCISKTKGNTILDPYMGSGTTLVAAKLEQRKAIGIEIEERYCEIAAKRLAQEVFQFA